MFKNISVNGIVTMRYSWTLVFSFISLEFRKWSKYLCVLLTLNLVEDTDTYVCIYVYIYFSSYVKYCNVRITAKIANKYSQFNFSMIQPCQFEFSFTSNKVIHPWRS